MSNLLTSPKLERGLFPRSMRPCISKILMKYLPQILTSTLLLFAFQNISLLQAQGFGRGPRIESPEVKDGQVTFRILAPQASTVKVNGSDIPSIGQNGEMTKNDDGIWEATLEIAPGYYRYNFNVDGVSVIDPRNPSTSESNENIWSLVGVTGNDWMDTQDVPRGAVAQVTYHSDSLDRFRRMHVYTPPGYQKGEDTFPVFYLLHGASDCDNSWSSVMAQDK
jgi:hypothetical protein